MNAKEPSSRALEDKISAEVAIRAGARLINTTMRQNAPASISRPTIESLPRTPKALPNLPAACSSPEVAARKGLPSRYKPAPSAIAPNLRKDLRSASISYRAEIRSTKPDDRLPRSKRRSLSLWRAQRRPDFPPHIAFRSKKRCRAVFVDSRRRERHQQPGTEAKRVAEIVQSARSLEPAEHRRRKGRKLIGPLRSLHRPSLQRGGFAPLKHQVSKVEA